MNVNIGQCSVCGKPATGSVLKDPFGKSDVMEPRCPDHGMRLRDPQDVAEITRLTAALAVHKTLCPACERIALGSPDETTDVLRRAADFVCRWRDAGPQDCDCTMDGGVHTCGWPELKGLAEQLDPYRSSEKASRE